jgi:hypothetical protein
MIKTTSRTATGPIPSGPSNSMLVLLSRMAIEGLVCKQRDVDGGRGGAPLGTKSRLTPDRHFHPGPGAPPGHTDYNADPARVLFRGLLGVVVEPGRTHRCRLGRFSSGRPTRDGLRQMRNSTGHIVGAVLANKRAIVTG